MVIIKDFRVWFLLFCLLSQGVMAQNQSGNHWYFGTLNRGVVFNRPNYEADLYTNKLPLGQGGSAVATDPVTGNVLFYTDGTRLIDASNTVMPNGNGLNGSASLNQGVGIVQNPSIATEYHVFYLSATGNLLMSVVDMNIPGNSTSPKPLGDLDITSINDPVVGVPSNLSECMLILPDPNGTDFWMILHSNNSNAYHFIKIDAGGPAFVSTQTVGSITNVANLSYHPASETIGAAPKALNQNVETLTITFDPASLAAPELVSTPVINSAVTTGAGPDFIYDTEFSANGKYLYVSYASGDVVQFDLENNTPPAPLPRSILPTPHPTASYGLQMGPDSVIYHLYQEGGNFFLGAIDSTNNAVDSIVYTPQIIAGNFGAKQFSSFAVSNPTDISIAFVEDGLCANSPTSFYPTVAPRADSLVWDFGDGTSIAAWSPVHTYQSGGTFNVTVTAYLNGESQQASKSIDVTNFDLQITLPQDTIACSCELPFPKAAPPPAANPCNPFRITAQLSASAQWSWFGPAGLITSGSGTNAVLQPDSAGYYYLVATNGTCSTHSGINIKEYGLEDQRANIWYFGNNAGIDFNPAFKTPAQPAVPISNTVMNAPEGTSTISDQNGQVIFFTDGDKVWTKNGETITEIATGIGGDPGSTQAALIVPVAEDQTLYYIFTTQEIYGSNTYRLSYSLFDLKMNGGTGGMRMTNVELFSPSTERIASDGVYLLAHEYGNNAFHAYPITAGGIGAPIISTAGSPHLFAHEANGAGYMKFGDGGKVAVALSTPGVQNVIEIFDFNAGVISNVQQIDLNNTTGQVYGIEISGRKIFATVGNRVYEYFFGVDGDIYQVQEPPYLQVTETLGAIQRGPDGQFYIAADGENYLKMLTVSPDSTASVVNTNFNLAGGSSSTLGLPSFIQTLGEQLPEPALTFVQICLGDTTIFTVSGTESIDTVTWSFGDGAGATGVQLTEQRHRYASVGEYDVIVRVTNRCIGLVREFREKVIIRPRPADPTQSVALCDTPLTLDANIPNATDLSYQWSTLETTRTITVNQPGAYTVTVTDVPSGCTTPGNILVIRPIADFGIGADAQVCVGEPNRELNTGINIPQHTWTLNGAAIGGSGPRITTDFSTPGTKVYRVAFFDTFSGCTMRDTVTFVVSPRPTATLTTFGNVTCGLDNGILAVGITAPSGRNMVYRLEDPTGANIATQTVTTVPFTNNHNNLGAGTYALHVTDALSGCTFNTATTINVSDFTVDDFSQSICEPIQIPIQTTVDLTSPVNYVIRNTANNVATPPIPLTSNGQLSTDFFAPGIYLIEVSTEAGCISSGTATLTQNSLIENIDFDLSNFCTDRQILVTHPGVATYVWAPTTAIASGETSSTVTVTDAPGVYTLEVTIDDGVNCPTKEDITVSVDNFSPAIVSQVCDVPYTLTATPTNNAMPLSSYVYAWHQGATNVGAGQVITISTGGNYTLTMANLTTGCSRIANSAIVIPTPFTVAIQPLDVPCDGGEPFRLEAITTPAILGLTYQWELNDVSVGTNNAVLSGQLQAGKYEVTVSDGICPRTSAIDVFLLPATKGNLPTEAFICPEPENPKPETRQVVLDPGSGFNSYEWFEIISGGASPLGITDQTFTADRIGTFRVLLENAFGCFSRNETEILIDCEPVIAAPNAFRPSSSLSINQQFKLITLFIDQEDFQIYIYNRWGELVFESDNLDFGWNGGYNNNGNQLLPAGTYSYLVRYKSKYRPEEGLQEKRGGLVLVR